MADPFCPNLSHFANVHDYTVGDWGLAGVWPDANRTWSEFRIGVCMEETALEAMKNTRRKKNDDEEERRHGDLIYVRQP